MKLKLIKWIIRWLFKHHKFLMMEAAIPEGFYQHKKTKAIIPNGYYLHKKHPPTKPLPIPHEIQAVYDKYVLHKSDGVSAKPMTEAAYREEQDMLEREDNVGL